MLKALLHILNTIDKDAGVLGANFTGKMKLMNSTWREMRKYVKPVKKGSWEPMSDLAPNINDQVLYIPVRKGMNGKHSEWACIVRLEMEDSDTPWTFMVFDPKECMGDTVREMRRLIHGKSTLHLSEDLIDEVDNKEARKNTNTKWHHIMSPPLEGCKGGHRMVLYMIITIGGRSTTEMLCRMNALKEVKDLEVKTCTWIADIVTDGRNMYDPPPWIKEVLVEEIETDGSNGSPDARGSGYDNEISGEDMDISEEEEEEKVRGKKRNVSSRESLT